MRASCNTILQTLTPEALSVLSHSVADAGRRAHGQTTPLHVAATLLSWPNGFLRQACIRSHPNLSHPLQCRALELCFTVALERLPSCGLPPAVPEPPLSNALVAALKRAQAHQRRECPEQQQQPLLAVKVEWEQLVISVLDDPGVSRVMKEAGFSSVAVKVILEKAVSDSTSNSQQPISIAALSGITPRNSYRNPRLQIASSPAAGQRVAEDVKKVVGILQREKKRNPVLVGDHEPALVVEELLRKLERKEFGEGFSRVQVLSVEKELGVLCEGKIGRIHLKIKELGLLIESKVRGGYGMILNLGDLQWLVKQGRGLGLGAPAAGCAQVVVSEMGKLVARGGACEKVWLMGIATCETYLRCQVYHPSMESDLDLQPVPIAARSPLPGTFSRTRGDGIVVRNSLSSNKPFQGDLLTDRRLSENVDQDASLRHICCPSCMENYAKELLAHHVPDELELSLSVTGHDDRHQQQQLPQWLQLAKSPSNEPTDQSPSKDDDKEQVRKKKTEKLQRKWKETCNRLHRESKPTSPPFTTLLASQFSVNGSLNDCDPHPAWRQPLQPKLQQTRDINVQVSATDKSLNLSMGPPRWSPARPVRTDLVLGHVSSSPMVNAVVEVDTDGTKDFTYWDDAQPISGAQFRLKSSSGLTGNHECFKKLFNGLTEKVSWQSHAAAMVATAVSKYHFMNGKRRGRPSKGDTWLLFLGVDGVGKKKMAAGLAELVFGNRPLSINLGQAVYSCDQEDDECSARLRGRTLLDRIADAVHRNPSSIVVLENVDHANNVILRSLIHAMETGRLTDSHGREASLCNAIFILTTTEWMPESYKGELSETIGLNEAKLASDAATFRPLQLRISNSRTSSGCLATNKRSPPAWLEEREGWMASSWKRRPAIDLNLSADNDNVSNGSHDSHNSSDLTIETTLQPPPGAMKDIADQVDEVIIFKPVNYDWMSKNISDLPRAKFFS